MSNVTSAGVSRRFQDLFEASNQAFNLSPSVAEVLIQDLLPALAEGEIMPDVVLLQKLIGRRIALANDELENGDLLRKHLKNIDRHRREVLDKASAKLRNALVDVRYILDRTLSKKQAKAVFEGRSQLSRLKSPVLERVGERLVSLLADPKLGWDQISDAGYRANVDASRARLAGALADFTAAESEVLPEKDALLNSLGNFERDYEEKGARLRRRLRWLRGFYEGAGFEREAAALVFRRRATPKPAEEPKDPEGPPAEGTPGPASPRPPAAATAVASGSGERSPSAAPVASLPALSAPAAPSSAASSGPSEGRRKRHRSRRGPQTA